MSGPRRTLVVMRHAKAEQAGPTDYERALTPRGHVDAAAAGAWLRESGTGVPDRAVVSAALRTEETWRQVCQGAGWDLAPQLDRGLYAADVDTAFDLLRLLDDDVATALVLGHNPTMASLAQVLDDGEGDHAATHEMTVGTFPTSAVAVLDVSGSWGDLGPGAARLTGYHVGRG